MSWIAVTCTRLVLNMEQERMYGHTSRLIIAYLLNKALYWLSVALNFSDNL